MSVPLLRTATLDDLDAIMGLESSTFSTDAWSTDSMRAELANPHARYLVAVRDEAIVGYAGLLAPRRSEQADIQTITVAPDARRGGLGRALMNALITEARGRGAREIFLEVRADNPGAMSLYENLGFRVEGRKRDAYRDGDGYCDAIVMALLEDEYRASQLD